MISAPCKDCPDRKIGCHSECDKYADYTVLRDQALAEKHKRRVANSPLMAPEKIRNINKAHKGR